MIKLIVGSGTCVIPLKFMQISEDNVPNLNPKVDTPLFATYANPLQLYHSPRAKMLALNVPELHLFLQKSLIFILTFANSS